MIGQRETKNFVLQSKKPCILVGKKGMGKLTLCNELYPTAKVIGNGSDKIKIDSIREVIKDSINLTEQVYIIRNCDNLTLQSQNALLKILEDCPSHVRFVLLCIDIDRLLMTIKSRCNIYRMPLYTNDEIEEYVKLNYPHIRKFALLHNYCMGVIGKVDRIAGKKFKDIRDLSLKIVSNLDKASVGNVFNLVKYFEPFSEDVDLILDTLMVMYNDIHLIQSGCEEQIIDFALLETYKNLQVDRPCQSVIILAKYKSRLGIPYSLTPFVDNLMLELKGMKL